MGVEVVAMSIVLLALYIAIYLFILLAGIAAIASICVAWHRDFEWDEKANVWLTRPPGKMREDD